MLEEFYNWNMPWKWERLNHQLQSDHALSFVGHFSSFYTSMRNAYLLLSKDVYI